MRIEEQLKLVGITQDKLSRECQASVDLVAKITEKLQLNQPRLNPILIKWSSLCLEQISVDDKKASYCAEQTIETLGCSGIDEDCNDQESQTGREDEGAERPGYCRV